MLFASLRRVDTLSRYLLVLTFLALAKIAAGAEELVSEANPPPPPGAKRWDGGHNRAVANTLRELIDHARIDLAVYEPKLLHETLLLVMQFPLLLLMPLLLLLQLLVRAQPSCLELDTPHKAQADGAVIPDHALLRIRVHT